jgi:hypothetical protein
VTSLVKRLLTRQLRIRRESTQADITNETTVQHFTRGSQLNHLYSKELQWAAVKTAKEQGKMQTMSPSMLSRAYL